MPFCKESIQKYHLNILRMINTLYHIYIETELFNLADVDQMKIYHESYFLKYKCK